MRHVAPLIALFSAFAAPSAAQPSRSGELHAFLQERFADERASYPDTRYVAGWADVNADGRQEAFVYMMSGNYCGSGGCSLFIFTPEQASFYQMGHMTVTQTPIRVLNSRTRGWRDLAVGVSGGGTPARTMIMQHRGATYPGNPTTDGTMARGSPPGQMIIANSDRARRLF